MTTENEYNHIWKYTKIKREHNLNCVPPTVFLVLIKFSNEIHGVHFTPLCHAS